MDDPYDVESAAQIKALFSLPDKSEMVRFILRNNVIPEDLRISLEHARRLNAVRAFEKMLGDDLREHPWQKWFEKQVRVWDELVWVTVLASQDSGRLPKNCADNFEIVKA